MAPKNKQAAPADADANPSNAPAADPATPAADAPYVPVGEVTVLAEKERDGFMHRVLQDAVRVWKEVEEIL